jgi:hypothetical protein
MSTIRLKKVRNLLVNWFQSHDLVNSAKFGDFVQMYMSEQIQHSCVVIDLIRVPELTRSKIGYQFVFTYADRMFADRRNETDIKNDCVRVFHDFVIAASNDIELRKYITGLTTGNIEIFSQRSGDLVAGGVMTVSINIISDQDKCAIPITPIPTPPPPTCADVIVQLNEVTTFTLPSGATQNINLLDENEQPLEVIDVDGDDVTVDIGLGAFIIGIRTNNAGTSNNDQMLLPIQGTNMTIDWGDGTIDTNLNQTNVPDGTVGSGNNVIHTYPSAGTYIIKISGGLTRIFYNNQGDRLKQLAIYQWGNIAWERINLGFIGCNNNQLLAQDIPNLTNVVTNGFREVFHTNTQLTANTFIANWQINNGVISQLNFMFFNTQFNQDISGWDVSNCNQFSSMFRNTPFNHNLGSWQLLQTSGPFAMDGMFLLSGMSTENYTDTIVGWANSIFVNGGLPNNVNMSNQTGRTFDTSRSGGANFTNAGDARDYLTVTLNWAISGDTVI